MKKYKGEGRTQRPSPIVNYTSYGLASAATALAFVPDEFLYDVLLLL